MSAKHVQLNQALAALMPDHISHVIQLTFYGIHMLQELITHL